MSGVLADSDELVALGAFVGAQVLLVFLCVVVANAYRERSLLLHGAALMLGVLAEQLLVGGHVDGAQAALLLALAAAGFQLRDLVTHAGALRDPRRWLVGTSLVLLPLLALGAAFLHWDLLGPGLMVWCAVMAVLMLRAWPQCQPWARWLLPSYAALVAAAAWLAGHAVRGTWDPLLPMAGLLTLWGTGVFIAALWRSRIFGETRVRVAARNTVDPLTGLATPLVFAERVRAARGLIRRYGHPSALLLVHIENLPKLIAEHGPEIAESAMLVAATRVRAALADGDVAARLAHSRIAILAEGMSLPEAASNIASKVVAAGMREPLPAAPADFLHFRVVMATVPTDDVPARALMGKLAHRMDRALAEAGERRIVSVSHDELMGGKADDATDKLSPAVPDKSAPTWTKTTT
jgi:GGDEF domain-containing protein